MICDSCGQPIDPDEPALRRAVIDHKTGEVIGQWDWHRDCPPAGPESDYDLTPPCNSTDILGDDNVIKSCSLPRGHLGSCHFAGDNQP